MIASGVNEEYSRKMLSMDVEMKAVADKIKLTNDAFDARANTEFSLGQDVLDKLEGVLVDQVTETRRWAEDLEISALLARLQLRALVLRPQDVETSCWKPDNSIVRFPDELEGLATDAPELFFLHWSDGAYEHFATVANEEGAVWFVPADRRESSLAFLRE